MVCQAVSYILHILPFVLLWFALLQNWLPGTYDFTTKNHEIILYAPVYAVVMLGIYAVCSVLYGVATFNDCQLARDELKKEIEEARAELRKRNVIS
uniref:Dolichol-phosphate mannosyltransferase subunit 3 n=1 Tax=Ascaris suum TaxID=6253 RepID=F1LH41_ASCSU